MRPALNLIASVTLAVSSALTAAAPAGFGRLPNTSVLSPSLVLDVGALNAKRFQDVTASPVTHFGAIGLSLCRPYVRGKIPVVLIHGLGATPASWARMIEGLEADPIIRRHYQFWTFGYATGEPILYSASLLRRSLSEARERYDPAKTDAAFDRMVLIGHSMGGILAKLMAEDSRSVLWERISSQPVEKLRGPADAREVLRQSFFFKPVPEVRRIVYIATPHRGSDVDHGPLHWLASRLNQPLVGLRNSHELLLAGNDPEFFHKSFRDGLPSSVDQLAWESPLLMSLFDLNFYAGVRSHSIIADVNDPPGAGGTDGVVPYASSHLESALSELIVPGGHLCQANPPVIRECARILKQHLNASADRSGLAQLRTGASVRGPLTVREPDSGPPARSVRPPESARAVDRPERAKSATVAQ
jgi:pimeloyl-ACP methyl ester carboxylesterase